MDTTLLRQATKAWPKTPFVPKATTKHLRREWLKKIEQLGDNWLFAKANYVTRR